MKFRPASPLLVHPAATAALVTLVGAVCAFAAIGSKSFWYDEGVSVSFATLDWPTLRAATGHVDAVLAPYYALLHLWLDAFGRSELAARSLSALGAVAALPFVCGIARRLFGPATALIAGLLAATSTFFVQYADDARPYGLELCASALALWCFVQLVERPTTRWAVGYGVALAIAAYLHLFALAGALAQLCSLACMGERRRTVLPWLGIGVALAAVLCAPLAAFAAHVGMQQIGWIPRPGLADLWWLLVAFSTTKASAVIALVCIMLALRGDGDTERRRTVAWVTVWVAVPIAADALLSLAHPAFLPRYLVCAYVPFVLLVAAGITSLRRIPLGAPLLATLLIAIAVGAQWTQRATPIEDFRAAANVTVIRAGTHDAVVAFPPASVYAFDAELARTGGGLRARIAYPHPTFRYWTRPEANPVLPTIADIGPARHIWLIERADVVTPALDRIVRTAFAGRFRLAQICAFQNLRVVELVRRSLQTRTVRRNRSAK